MAAGTQEESAPRRKTERGKLLSGELSKLSAIEAIEKIAAYDARHTTSDEGMLLFLQSWWSRTYNRPLKDPLLQSYTLHELLYEFHDKQQRKLAAEVSFEEEADKIEEAKEQETLDWVEEEEKKEREAAAEAKRKQEEEKWMLEQLKKEHGEDFGEDINLDLSE